MWSIECEGVGRGICDRNFRQSVAYNAVHGPQLQYTLIRIIRYPENRNCSTYPAHEFESFPRSGYFYYPAIDDRNFLSNRNIVEYRDCAPRRIAQWPAHDGQAARFARHTAGQSGQVAVRPPLAGRSDDA
ncbi:hypothetical protein BVI2075_400036 [Burkholderia vietnamiensis]|nr:hypothetical protein BVI2075_400036 [Burkholderia vietnamiensis]